MLAGILTVVLIVVGLPLLMFWVGGRRFWNRSYGTETGDLYRRMVREHVLKPAEIAQVEGALAWGRELQDERLRAAVVDWARQLQRMAEQRRGRHPRRARAVRVLTVAWLLLLLAYAGLVAAEGEWWRVLHAALYGVSFAALGRMVARAPRRAIQRNSGPPSDRALPRPR